MHILVGLFIATAGDISILLCGKSRQTFLIDIETKWVHTSHSDVDSQIKFESIEQERARYILTDNILTVIVGNFLEVARDKDATALRTRRGLHNPLLSWISFHVFF